MINCEFFYGKEADQFKFYRIPQILVLDKRFKDVSYGAKLLYGLLLDRMGLSIQNKWFDDKNHAYIIYSIKEIMKSISCSKGTAVKFMSELESIGLIARKKRGQGLADHIYVKKFVDGQRKVVQRSDLKKSEASTSESPKDELQEVQILETNNTDINNTDLVIPSSGKSRKEYEEMIKENIEYDILKTDFKDGWLDNIIEIMLDVLSSDSKTVRINSSNVPIEQVRERYLSINDMHIRYLDDTFRRNTSKVRDVRSFFITAIYNAPVTMNAFYDVWVKNDMKGGSI